MEWPAHHLLRHQCAVPLADLEGASVSSSSMRDIDASVNLSNKHTNSCFCVHCNTPYEKQSSGLDPLTATAASSERRKKKSWQRKCISYSRLGGWYILAAEILGTIILITLCVVAANQARSMSAQVDTAALAALARSNPRAICVNASTDSVQGRVIPGINLQLVPSSFRDANGRHWKRAGVEAGMRSPMGLWNHPLSSQTVPMDAAFTQSMLAAMFKCGVVRGAYHSQDLPSFISRRCSQCHIELGASLNTSWVNTSWAASDDINMARAHPALEVKQVQYRMANVVNASLASEQLSQLLQHALGSGSGGGGSGGVSGSEAVGLAWVNDTSNLLMFAHDAFLPGLEAMAHPPEQIHDLLVPLGSSSYESGRPGGGTSSVTSSTSSSSSGTSGTSGTSSSSSSSSSSGSGDFSFFNLIPSASQPSLQWMETSLYLSEESWHVATDHSHQRHLDPRAVPAGTLRVDVYHTPPSYGGWLSEPTQKGRAGGVHVSSLFLELAQQTPRTAHCMAETATLAAQMLNHARYTLRHPNGTVVHNCRPGDINMTFEQLWLRLDANLDAARPYACAEGVDVTSADATAYLTRLDAYKSTAKAQYRTTIFMSMHHQTAEDIYAVYTGALGAVFGSMALLVATLFVYAIALAQHIFVSHLHTGEEPREHPA